MSNKDILSTAQQFQPTLVGLGLTSHYLIGSLKELVEALREVVSCPIAAGGHYFAFRAEEIMNEVPDLDVAVLGEGEEAIVSILRCLSSGEPLSSIPNLMVRSNGRVDATPVGKLQSDLDTLAFPTRQTGLEVYNVSASRGCFTTCSFCSVPQFTRSFTGRALRLRSPDSIRREVESLKSLGVRAISFVDDVFLLPGSKGAARAKNIADIMSAHSLKWAFGCRTPDLTEEIVKYCRSRGLCNIGIGIESGAERVLERFSKRASIMDSVRAIELCRRYDISIQPYFIMFEPDLTVDDLKTNLEFLNGYGLLWPSFARSSLDPYPGTPAFDALQSTGRLKREGYGYVPSYSDVRVAHFRLTVQPILTKAQKTEFALRRAEFRADLQDGERGVTSRKNARRHLAELSQHTYDYLTRTLSGESRPADESAYLATIEDIARRLSIGNA